MKTNLLKWIASVGLILTATVFSAKASDELPQTKTYVDPNEMLTVLWRPWGGLEDANCIGKVIQSKEHLIKVALGAHVESVEIELDYAADVQRSYLRATLHYSKVNNSYTFISIASCYLK